MPITWTISRDLLALVLVGEYTFYEIADAFRDAFGAASSSRVRLLLDVRGAARVPDDDGIHQRAALLREFAPALAGPVAIVTAPGMMKKVSRQVADEAESRRLRIETFTSLAEAQAWLDAGLRPI